MEKQQESIGTGQQQAHAQFPILKNKSLVPRQYQVEICRSIIEKGSTLVVLPTGLGKTLIAFLAMGHFLQEGKCVFLAPTKPLVQQHYRRILEDLDVGGEDVALVSGEIKPEQRADLWKRKIAVCTPQTLKNDVEAGRAVFDYAFCVFDEAHRTTGLYAYTHLAKLAVQQGTVVLAMTASPGSNMKKIAPLVEALGIKNVQIRTDEDESVAKYVQKVQINYVPVELDSRLWQIRQSLEKIIQQHFDTLCSMGFVGKFKSKKGLLELRDRIIRSTSHMRYSALSYFTTLFNLVHAQELFETQGVATFLSYIEKLKSRQQTKGIERILKDSRIKAIVQSLETGGEHPKLAKLVELLENVRGQKTIVFVQYRAQISTIVAKLCSLGFKAQRFVGKKEGVTQAIQRQTMEKFRSGEFDILVASSIGEEGLDVPSVDNVIFFEPVGSEIRTIQRRGRAGRAKAGKIYVLITKGTRDESHFWSSRKKEGRMENIVRQLQAGMPLIHSQKAKAGHLHLQPKGKENSGGQVPQGTQIRTQVAQKSSHQDAKTTSQHDIKIVAKGNAQARQPSNAQTEPEGIIKKLERKKQSTMLDYY